MILLNRYATAWEGQIGRLWYGIMYPRFWRTSFPVFVRWAPDPFEDAVEEYFKTHVPKGYMQRIDGIACFSPLTSFWFWHWRLNRLVKRGVLNRRRTGSIWPSCDGMPSYGWNYDQD